MNNDYEPMVERLRQADARLTPSGSPIDPAAMATRVNRRRLARKRHHLLAGTGAATVGIIALAFTNGMLTRQFEAEHRTADIDVPADQSKVIAEASAEYQARALALQKTIDELAELERKNEQLRRLLDERKALDSQIQLVTDLSSRLRECQLDVIRAELSQTVFDQSKAPIVFGF